MTLEIQTDLLALQRQRERHSLQAGLKKYREKTNLGTFQQRLFKDFLPPLIEAIDKRREEKQGTKPKLADFVLAALTSEELALITILSVMYCIADSQQDLTKTGRQYAATLRRTSLRIGQHCRDHFLREMLAEVGDGAIDAEIESRLTRALLDRQNNANAGNRVEDYIEAMKTEQWWSVNRMIAVGAELIHIAMATTGLFEKTKRALGKKEEKETAILLLSEKGAKWLAARRSDRQRHQQDAGILAIPVNMPMLIEPKPWTDLKGGGYLTLTAALIKPNDKNVVPDNFYDVKAIPEVTAAVDILQRTPWQINERLFEAYKKFWDNRSYRRKLFDPDQMFSENELEASIETKIATSQELLGKTFFFPYQLDFRGRIYPVPHIINTQSDDPTRSLLQFAEEQPVNERSEYWTSIHAANAFGLNKLTLDRRHEWCRENWSQIQSLAADPARVIDFWTQAKEPWSFLAACYELVEIKRGVAATRLPIYVDGKCNGLQHLSAMSRDEHAGAMVNVIPSEEPQDIYDHVAQNVQAVVLADKDESAKFWRKHKVTRDLVKRPVMTTPYGVTPGGIRDQLKDASKKLHPDKDTLTYLARKVRGALEDIMHGPAEVQKWLQSVAKAMAKAQQPIIWTVPSGFRVHQDYREVEFKRVPIGNITVRFYLPADDTKPVDKDKQVTSIIANFVHSLDAAHLVKVVNKLNAAGISAVGVVHDSFGVHSCHVDTMNRVIREEFVRIYSEPVLDKFLQEQVERTGLSLPKFEAYGDLAINDVLRSPYFFS